MAARGRPTLDDPIPSLTQTPGERESARVWAIIAGALALSALALVLVTAGASRPLYPTAVTFILFACAFPVHARTVYVIVRHKRRTGETLNDPRRLIWPPPFGKRLGYGILAAYAAAGVLVALGIPSIFGGQPERHGDRFYLDDHGHLTRVTEAQYYAGLIGGDRLFLAGAAVFLGLGAVFNMRLARDPSRES